MDSGQHDTMAWAKAYGDLGIVLETRGDLNGAAEMYGKGHVMAEDRGRPARGPEKGGEHADHGGLASAVRAQETVHGALRIWSATRSEHGSWGIALTFPSWSRRAHDDTVLTQLHDGQTGAPGAVLPDRLVIIATDPGGNPIGGLPVTWTVLTGGGTILSAMPATGPQGYANIIFQLGPTTGQQTVQASVPGATPVMFTLTAN